MNRSWILALGLGAALSWAGLLQADDDERKDDGAPRPPSADAPPRERDNGPRRGPPEGREAGRREGDANGRRARRDDGEDGVRRGPRDEDRDSRRPSPPREDGDLRAPPPPRGGRPGGFPQGMGPMDPRGDMERLKQHDPEMFALAKSDMEMEQQTRQLVEQYHRAANDADRDQIRGKLAAVVENHFAVRQERRELEVKRLQAQLQRLRDSLKKRGEERQKIIEQHLSQLLGNEDAGF